MIRARSARLRRVVAARTHAVSCARSCAATANLVATAMLCLHHAITGMASELTRRDTSTQPPQVRGFGFLHDGSIDTLFRFHNPTVFNGGFGSQSNPNQVRRPVEQFMLVFPSNLAPIVGQQITLDSGGAGGGRVDLLIRRAT